MATATKVAHTPAPWKVERNDWNCTADRDTSISIMDESEGVFVAQAWTDFEAQADDKPIDGIPPYGTGLANAHLIAAAPDLLAACRALVKYATQRDGTPASHEDIVMAFVEDGSTLTECLDLARAALLKAEGVQ